MIGAFPSNPGAQVKYMDVASVSLTTGVDGGDGFSETDKKKITVTSKRIVVYAANKLCSVPDEIIFISR